MSCNFCILLFNFSLLKSSGLLFFPIFGIFLIGFNFCILFVHRYTESAVLLINIMNTTIQLIYLALNNRHAGAKGLGGGGQSLWGKTTMKICQFV